MERGISLTSHRTALAVCWSLTGAALAYAAFLAWQKYFTVDEFQYAHAAWLVARGSVPYRDFFDHHFPLLYQLLAAAYVVLPDDPATIRFLRLLILPFLALIAGAGAAVNRRWGPYAAALVLPLMMITRTFAFRATEIRPDVVSTAFFLVALAIVWRPVGPTSAGYLRGAFLGTVLTLGIWSSQKALYYIAPFVLLLLVDWVSKRRRGARSFLGGSFVAFAVAAGLVATSIAVYLLVTDSWREWFLWCVRWSVVHQTLYPYEVSRWPMWTNFLSAIWLLPLAAVGLIRSIARNGESDGREIFLSVALFSTAASFLLQKAPYEYSLIPFLAIVAIYAARGADVVIRHQDSKRWILATSGALLLLIAGSLPKILLYAGERNSYQLSVLRKVGQLTGPGDVVYDNSGSAVTRPHVGYFSYTDSLLRRVYRQEILRPVPRAIVEAEAKLYIVDARHFKLPAGLLDFIYRYYQPYSGDLRVWGQRYVAGSSQRTFLAVSAGRYFVDPPVIGTSGALRIGRLRITTSEFDLPKGVHSVEYSGPPVEFSIIWLPRNGERFTPRRGESPRFSPLL